MYPLITIDKVNSLSDNEFESVFANVVELYPEAAIHIKGKRPFSNVNELVDAFHSYLDKLSVENKLIVLKLHPDLAGKLAKQGELTPESVVEQQAAGLGELTPQQKSVMDQNNQRYKDKFGFPFIICARENKVQSILDGLESRYTNSYEQEINTGVNEVKKICKLRLLNIVKN